MALCRQERNGAFPLKARDPTAVWGAKTENTEAQVMTNLLSSGLVLQKPRDLLVLTCRYKSMCDILSLPPLRSLPTEP